MENNNHNLTISQNKHTSLMQLESSKPTLAKLNEDFPKVRNVIVAAEIEDLMNYLIRILNIKTASKEEQDNLDFQMPLILDFIKSKFGTLTIPEIKEAFKMYVAKEFPELKVFRMLDCVAVGEVLNAYTNFRNESLRVYDSKKKKIIETLHEPTEKEKKENFENLLKSIFDDLTQKGFSSDAWLLFSKLEDSGKLKISLEEKKALYHKQLRIYEIEEQAEIRGKYGINSKVFLQDLHNKITDKKPVGSVVNKCRSITSSNYLKNYIQDYEVFKKEIG
jgi:hypothetical protein